jgi:kinesin family protein 23
VTGSGKTFTMSGTPEDIGILPRCIDVVFNSIKQSHAMQNLITYEGNNSYAVHSFSDAFGRKQSNLYPKIPKTPGGFRRVDLDGDEEENRVKDTTFVEVTPSFPKKKLFEHLTKTF